MAPLPLHFQRTLDALGLVAPLCIAARYEDGLRHCVEASVSGAAVLRRRKIAAKPIPCAVTAMSDDGDCLSIGFNARQIYERVVAAGGSHPPFETWKAGPASGVPNDESPLHEIIEARFSGKRALVDLTIGQLRSTGHPSAAQIPLTVVGAEPTWPSLTVPPWTISYSASPHAASVVTTWNTNVNKYSNAAFVDDLDGMVELALRLDLDRARLHAELLRQAPEVFESTIARLAALANPR